MTDARRAVADDVREAPTNPDGTTPRPGCPACRSLDVTTTSKTVDAESYWRCLGCGNVWNVRRQQAGSGRARNVPFRR
jgi:transposase-like protein